MAPLNPYEVLGVPADADAAGIKAAYRKASKESHPDKGGCPDKMGEINRAYAILSDPVKRRRYDETGVFDDDAPPALSEAQVLLAQVAEACVEQLTPGQDLIAIIRQEIRSNQSSWRSKMPKAIEKAARWKREIARVKCASEHNLISGMLERKAREAQLFVDELVKAIAQADEMLTLLEDYTYEAPPVEKQTAAPRRRAAVDSFFAVRDGWEPTP